MAHPDLDLLFNELLPFAQKMLAEHGGFNPFGAKMSSSGEVAWVAADNCEEYPPAQRLIEMLTTAFQQEVRAGLLRAAGICYDVRVGPSTSENSDAICCGLEHQSGEAVDVFVPYEKTADGTLVYKEAFTSRRLPEFFASNC